MGLVLAATPLGDARDASQRLVEAFGTADIVAAEDTRRTRALVAALGATITGKVISFYDAVEVARIDGLVEAIAGGQTVLLVTDAGMPSVSDPGYRLVTACVENELPITCLPGPSAVTTALALSGLPCERFCFEGFAPRKPGERARWLRSLADEPRTAVFFESPHRIATTMADAAQVLGGERRAAICRELTKQYEEVRRGTLAELAEWAADGVRGEITVVLAPAPKVEADLPALVEQVRALADDGMRLKDAAAQIAAAHDVSKKALYDSAVAMNTNSRPGRSGA
jgi:16S rRNA (cytidine1402-2'-O)-methyltransferase